MKPRLHNCSATGCQRAIPLNLLMCSDHWRMVPVACQREVWRTYRLTEQRQGLPALELLTAARAYRAAVELLAAARSYQAAVRAAIAAVAAKQLGKQAARAEIEGHLFAEPTGFLPVALPKEEHDNNNQAGQQPEA